MTAMPYRRLGRSGVKVSALSFGSWVTYGNQLGESSARECMAAAYDAGVNFFDNAEAYAGGQSEQIMGDAIAELLDVPVGTVRSRLRLARETFQRAVARAASRDTFHLRGQA